jgi:hypothetical protein
MPVFAVETGMVESNSGVDNSYLSIRQGLLKGNSN